MCDCQEKFDTKKASSDTDVNSQNPPASRSSNISHESEMRLPFTSSLASTLQSDKSRTISSESDNELRTVDKPSGTDCVRTDVAAVLQNGVVERSSHSPSLQVGDRASIPSLNGSKPAPTAVPSVASSNSLSQKEAENFVAQWTGGDSSQVVGGGATTDRETLAAAAGPLQTDDVWYYCDPQGQIQGQTLLTPSTYVSSHFMVL